MRSTNRQLFKMRMFSAADDRPAWNPAKLPPHVKALRRRSPLARMYRGVLVPVENFLPKSKRKGGRKNAS